MLLTVYLVFCLAISFQEKHRELKIFLANTSGTGQQQFLYLKYMFQVKKEKSNKPVQSLHSQTWPTLDAVLSNMKRLVEKIDFMIDRNCKKELEENRKRLAPIIDTVIFLGRLGLAFKGHRDDSQFHPNVGEYSSGGVGNFVEVLNYRVRGGDSVLENHLRTCSKNASYISKISKNELINCCGNYIKDILVKKIKENRFFFNFS